MTDAERSDAMVAGVRGRAPAVRTIVTIAAALFFIQATVVAPPDIEAALGFTSRDLGHRWWTLLSFTFVHANAWPLAVNLVVIGVFGAALERLWGTAEFARYYAICSLGAWIAHVTLVSSDVVLGGAGGPAIGIALAYAAHARDTKHLQVGAVGMSAGWLSMIASLGILLAGIATAPPATAVAYLVHAGGLVAGWLYLRTTSSIDLVRLRDAVSPVPDDPDDVPPRVIPRGQPKSQRMDDDIISRSNAAVAREAASRHTASPMTDHREPNRLNQLLDKISAEGIESLTADERRMLDDVSRRLRDH